MATKGWSLDSLISSSRTFRAVDRVPASSSELSEVIKDHERTGLPLVVEGFHRHENWPTKMFTIEGFEKYSESSGIYFAFDQYLPNSSSIPQILASVTFTPGQTES
jgi:methionine synthase II (cobalamin-independent)